MKAVFYHDSILKEFNNKYYASGGLNREYLQRYLQTFDTIELCTRKQKIEESDIKKYSVSSGEGISFNCIENLNIFSFIFGKNKKIIEESMKDKDIAIVRMPSITGIFAIKQLKKNKKVAIVEMVGCPWDAFWNHGIKGKVIAPYMYWKSKKILREANYAIYVSNEFLQKRYPTKGESVNCSNVVIKEINEEVKEKRIEHIKTRKENDKIILGTVGGLNVRCKGQQYVIKAIYELKKEGYQNIEYQLVGGGDSTYLENLIKQYNVQDNVKVIGPLPHEKVFQFMDNIDIYVQPSNQEGLCRSIIEAMSRACPCVVSTAGGNGELIDKNYVFNKKNIKELKKLIKKMNQEEMLKQAEMNFEKSKGYIVEKINNRRNNFYQKIIKENNIK